MRKYIAVAVLALALTAFVGCKTPTLETGGAYAPTATTANMPLYVADVAYKVAYDSVNAVFKIEYDNRAVLWQTSPKIKATLDGIRPQAWDAHVRWAAARKVYDLNPTPEGLSTLQTILANMQTLSTAAQAAIAAGGK